MDARYLFLIRSIDIILYPHTHKQRENHTITPLASSQRRWLNGWWSSSTSWHTFRGETLITHLLTFSGDLWPWNKKHTLFFSRWWIHVYSMLTLIRKSRLKSLKELLYEHKEYKTAARQLVINSFSSLTASDGPAEVPWGKSSLQVSCISPRGRMHSSFSYWLDI